MIEKHKPVLLAEVIESINIIEGGYYADFTLGDGGHTEHILSVRNTRLIAFDRDRSAIEAYRNNGVYRDTLRITLVHRRFSEADNLIAANSLDGAILDLGVSTRQLLDAGRGFSFFASGHLDMRMDQAEVGTLETMLSELSVDDLAAGLIRTTGLRDARKVSEKLLAKFRMGQIETTADIAEIMPPKRDKHPATVLFLALRMLVNEELREIESIPSIIPLLKPQGRLAIITFHSTEDRLVKTILRGLAGQCTCGKGLLCQCPKKQVARLVYRKPIAPSFLEIRANPRSRSAKLRVIERL